MVNLTGRKLRSNLHFKPGIVLSPERNRVELIQALWISLIGIVVVFLFISVLTLIIYLLGKIKSPKPLDVKVVAAIGIARREYTKKRGRGG